MMAVLQFDLPKDEYEYYVCSNGAAMARAIGEFSQKLRAIYKYEGKETISTYDTRQMLFDLFIEHGLDTDIL